jgi:membrane protein
MRGADRIAALVDLGRETIEGWNRDKVPRLAAALAFYTVFSVAPVLVIVVAVAGFVFGEQAARGQLAVALQGLVGRDAASTVQSLVENVSKPGSGVVATVLGLGTLLAGATGVFAELQDALNTIWGVQPQPGRPFWAAVRDRFSSFLMVLGIAVLLLASLVISTVLSALTALLDSRISGFVAAPLDLGISFALTTVLFALVYKVLPDVRIRWYDVWLGSALTAALFIFGKSLIGLYLGRSGIGSTYGAAGSFALILLWVFYSAQIFFLGAEFTKVYARRRGREIEPNARTVRIESTVQRN